MKYTKGRKTSKGNVGYKNPLQKEVSSLHQLETLMKQKEDVRNSQQEEEKKGLQKNKNSE